MIDAKEIRRLTGLSQAKFAEKYKIPRRTLEDWERGVRTPAPWALELLERVVKEDYKEEGIMFYIADDNGTVYAHDIDSRMKAELTLADILAEHPEYEELNIEVLDDAEE